MLFRLTLNHAISWLSLHGAGITHVHHHACQQTFAKLIFHTSHSAVAFSGEKSTALPLCHGQCTFSEHVGTALFD